VHHEGRGGWSAQDYIGRQSKDGVTNAFWNPNKSAFDFSYYLSNNSYSVPDVVFVNLGTNGTARPTDEVNAIKAIVNSIRSVSSTVPIVVSAIANGNATENAYIDIYLTQIREMQIAEFDGRMNGVYVAPIYLNINRMTDFNTETVAESSRNPMEVTRQINGVHPSKYGYFKFADVYWSVLQHVLG
jgi:lysophospholipase L1-like esterase